MKKIMSLVMSFCLCMTFVMPGFALAATSDEIANAKVGDSLSPTTPSDKLALAEKFLYGTAQEGALVTRTESMEQDVYGGIVNEGLVARITRLYNYLVVGVTADGTPSVQSKINAIEWQFMDSMSEAPGKTRIENIEKMLSGQINSNDSLSNRVDKLLNDAFPNGFLVAQKTVVPKDTLIKIKFMEEISSREVAKGDLVKFKADDNIYIDDALVIPKGSLGIGLIRKVSQPSSFGRDARIDIQFTSINAVDGTRIPIFLGELAKQEGKSIAGAAGASIGGMIIAGPIGIIGGAFVKGKAVVIPAGTTTVVQVLEDTPVMGLMQGTK
jgi:hypothetical protein